MNKEMSEEDKEFLATGGRELAMLIDERFYYSRLGSWYSAKLEQIEARMNEIKTRIRTILANNTPCSNNDEYQTESIFGVES